VSKKSPALEAGQETKPHSRIILMSYQRAPRCGEFPEARKSPAIASGAPFDANAAVGRCLDRFARKGLGCGVGPVQWTYLA
jgi:hypothetical protein